MTAPFNPAEATRLAAELAEDDERATAAPWERRRMPGHRFDLSAMFIVATEDGWQVADCYDNTPPEVKDSQCEANASAIARLRNNARAAADQLRAACEEVERHGAERQRLLGQEALAIRRNTTLSEVANSLTRAFDPQVVAMPAANAIDVLAAERDKLRAEVEGLKAGLLPASELPDHIARLAVAIGERDEARDRLARVEPKEDELDSVMSLLNWTRANHDKDSAARTWLERVVAAAIDAARKTEGE